MQAIRRIKPCRSAWAMRLARLRCSIPFLGLVLIMWAITGHRSLVAYHKMVEEMRPDNPLCSGSDTCFHIQIPLHLALSGHILSLYLLYEIVASILWLRSCYVSIGLLMTAEELNDWYRALIRLLIAIPLFPVLVLLGWYGNAGPQVAVMFAVFRSGWFVVCFLLLLHWGTELCTDRLAFVIGNG